MNLVSWTRRVSLLGAVTALTASFVQISPIAVPTALDGGLPVEEQRFGRPTVSFHSAASSGDESVQYVDFAVQLSAPPAEALVVEYALTSPVANLTEDGTGQDYAAADPSLTITFQPGVTRENIRLVISDDLLNEMDETVEIRLNPASGMALGQWPVHTYTIIDNDRRAVVSVSDTGAVGDGVTNDTWAVQSAINTVYRQGGGVVVFPPGTYVITSVNALENVTYYGYGATILRPPMQPDRVRTFTTNNRPYAGTVDSAPLIIQGLTFDGNSSNQGPYQEYELEHAHMLFLRANPAYPGRLTVMIEDCEFHNGVADAISVYTNAAVTVDNSRAVDVFRGGFVLTGGHSTARITNFTTAGKVDPTGIDIEVGGEGYGGSFAVDVQIRDLYLANGDLDIVVHDGSTVVMENVVSDDGPFYLFAPDSTVRCYNCRIKVGASDGKLNRFLFPHDVVFEQCELIVTRTETKRRHQHFAAVDVWWYHPSFETLYNQSLVFRDCTFSVDDTLLDSDRVYGVYSRGAPAGTNNSLVIERGCFTDGFDREIVVLSRGVQPQITPGDC